MLKNLAFILLTTASTACPNIEPVPISGNDSAEIARSAINTSAHLPTDRTCDELIEKVEEQVILVVGNSTKDIEVEDETLLLNDENIKIRWIQNETINDIREIKIFFDKINSNQPSLEGAFIGKIEVNCIEN